MGIVVGATEGVAVGIGRVAMGGGETEQAALSRRMSRLRRRAQAP
jgi:hypothetical protein